MIYPTIVSPKTSIALLLRRQRPGFCQWPNLHRRKKSWVKAFNVMSPLYNNLDACHKFWREKWEAPVNLDFLISHDSAQDDLSYNFEPKNCCCTIVATPKDHWPPLTASGIENDTFSLKIHLQKLLLHFAKGANCSNELIPNLLQRKSFPKNHFFSPTPTGDLNF